MDESLRLIGQTVLDFVNAETTEEACLKHFENIDKVIPFRPNFIEKVKDRFSSLSVLNSLNQKKIEEIQISYRNILEGFIQDKPFHVIPDLRNVVRFYDKLPKDVYFIGGEDFLGQSLPMDAANYFTIEQSHEWVKRFQTDLAICLVKFLLQKGAKSYIRRCKLCKYFYLSRTIRPSKFCSDKCRLAWHNRKRIDSGEAKEYKRKKRMEGAKESYYG